MTTIENRRFALMVAIGIILFLLYQGWQKDFAPKTAPPPSPAAQAPEVPAGDVPAASSDVPAPSATGAPAPAPAAAAAVAEQRVTVSTDKLTAVISTQGGDLRQVTLLGYPVAK